MDRMSHQSDANNALLPLKRIALDAQAHVNSCGNRP
jgi:hypothetical protein